MTVQVSSAFAHLEFKELSLQTCHVFIGRTKQMTSVLCASVYSSLKLLLMSEKKQHHQQ